MSAPVWMGVPPEVHSALLNSGPGAGSLLRAAAAWSSMSAEYAAAAEELSAALNAAGTGVWQGIAAQSYLDAHAPFVAWLEQSAAASTRIAVQHEIAAAAYEVAVATMPTLAELAANHAVHAVLVATNFFGVNTIPIAANEADYARLWVQAAATMSGYQTVSAATLAAAPPAAPAPRIVNAEASQPVAATGDPFDLSSLIAQLEKFEGAHSLLELIWPGNPFTPFPPGTDFGGALSDMGTSFVEGLFLYDPQTLAFAHNPAQLVFVIALAGVQLITHRIFDLVQLVYNFPQLLPAMLPLLQAPVTAVGGLAGLAGLAGLPQPAVVPAGVPPAAVGMQPSPTAVGTAAASGTSAPAPAPAAAAAPPPALPPPGAAPPVAGLEAFGYLVGGGGPDIGFGSGMGNKAQEPDAQGAAARATAPLARAEAGQRRRGRRRVGLRGYGDEYMDLDMPIGPAAVAADRGAGSRGFAGTSRKVGAGAPSGLATVAGDGFGGGPRMPMLPDGWCVGKTDR